MRSGGFEVGDKAGFIPEQHQLQSSNGVGKRMYVHQRLIAWVRGLVQKKGCRLVA